MREKRFAVGVVALCALLCLSGCSQKKADPNDPTVYVSPKSSLYHTADCSALGADAKGYSKSAVRAKGYKPCSQCQSDTGGI